MSRYKQQRRSERVDEERLRWMMGEMRLHLVGGVFAALLLGLVFSAQVDAAALWSWGLLNVAVTLLGSASLWCFYRRRDLLSLRGWGQFSVIMMLVWGMALAASPWLFLTSNDLLYVATLIVLLLGICASPASTLSLYPWAYTAFVTPVMWSLAAAIWIKGLVDSPLIRVLVPVFWLFLVGYGWRLHQVLLGSITMRLDKEEALQSLERSQALRARFLAAATHDIRQPLQAIGLHLGVLRQRFAGSDEAGLLERLHDSTESMSLLMDALLDVSRLDNQDIEPDIHGVALKPVLEKWLRQYEPLAQEKGLALQTEIEDLVVETDPLLLERIFLNLFTNAVRYTETGEIRVSLTRRRNNVVLEVQDSGCGIAADKHRKIFEAFQYLDNPARDRSQGLGLGLAIVERLVTLLGHDLNLQSEEGRGSTFSLTLPRGHKARAPDPVSAVAPVWESTGLNVLVVDDSPEVQEALASLLTNWQCDVRVQETPSLPTGWRPDFILTDFHLSGDENGVEVIERLRRQAGYCVPAVILSGDQGVALPEHFPQAVLLRKPVQPIQLRSVMRKLLSAA